MAKTKTTTQVGKRQLELSNLDKVLFPSPGIVKAELIQYYLQIAPTFLNHALGRPLSFVRFPDGIDGGSFFQKNRPKGTPEWIESVRLEEDQPEYILATEPASLVWMANQANIEIHQVHSHRPSYDKPDYMVFDLDPPENYPFERVISLAFEMKEHVEGYGYQSFTKTTGRKGLHLVVPLEAKWSFDDVFDAAQKIGQEFVKGRTAKATLRIRKDSRKEKVLVDVYRNRPSQTIISAYSVRGASGAPVSTPLRWEDLETVQDPAQLNIQTVPGRLLGEGDPWEGMRAEAYSLHTKRPKKAQKRSKEKGEKLESYRSKREFESTPEPVSGEVSTSGDAFVIQRHHATHLHYDLRLEMNGTLKSWAVPKGFPQRPGIKRLAVAVEDHPLEYLTFEGKIPKGEYGGGQMWIYAIGRYEQTRPKADSLYFRLFSPQLSGEFRLINTKGRHWLLERVDDPQVDWLKDAPEPMLADSRFDVPDDPDTIFEVKWDGIRATVIVDEGELTLLSRRGRDLTSHFPELIDTESSFRANSAVFDGEIVCLEEDGRPNFTQTVTRLHRSGKSSQNASNRHPAVCYLFDCLYLDGRSVMRDPLRLRREWLKDSIRSEAPFRMSEAVSEGRLLYEAAKEMGLEGIMAKDPESIYLPGRRSDSWQKIKLRQTMDCLILGYTEGEGDRKKHFGALQLGEMEPENQSYLGRVGTGWNGKMLKSVATEVKKLETASRPEFVPRTEDKDTVWVEPGLACEVQYASLTNNGTLREAVFLRLRPDLTD